MYILTVYYVYILYIEQLDYVADTTREMKDHIHTTTTTASAESAITTAATIDYNTHDVNITNNSCNEYMNVINSDSDVHVPHKGHLDG